MTGRARRPVLGGATPVNRQAIGKNAKSLSAHWLLGQWLLTSCLIIFLYNILRKTRKSILSNEMKQKFTVLPIAFESKIGGICKRTYSDVNVFCGEERPHML